MKLHCLRLIIDQIHHMIIQLKKGQLRGSYRVSIVMLAWAISTGRVFSATVGAGSPRHSNFTKVGWISAPSNFHCPCCCIFLFTMQNISLGLRGVIRKLVRFRSLGAGSLKAHNTDAGWHLNLITGSNLHFTGVLSKFFTLLEYICKLSGNMLLSLLFCYNTWV